MIDGKQDELRKQAIELGPGSSHPGTTGEVRLELEQFFLEGLAVWKDKLFVMDVLNRRLVKCNITHNQPGTFPLFSIFPQANSGNLWK